MVTWFHGETTRKPRPLKSEKKACLRPQEWMSKAKHSQETALWLCLVSGSVNSEQTYGQRFAELPHICSPSVFAESFCTGLSFFPCHLQTWGNMLAVPCYLATGCVACLTSVLTGEPGSGGMDVPSPWHPPLWKLFHRYSGVILNLIRIIYWISYRCGVFSLASVYSQFVRDGRMLSASVEIGFRESSYPS